MRLGTNVLSAAALTLLWAPGAAKAERSHPEGSPLMVEVSLPATEVGCGMPLIVHVRISNSSDASVDYRTQDRATDWLRFSVVRSTGAEAPRILPIPHTGSLVSGWHRGIGPHGVLEEDRVVNAECSITSPGAYEIDAEGVLLYGASPSQMNRRAPVAKRLSVSITPVDPAKLKATAESLADTFMGLGRLPNKSVLLSSLASMPAHVAMPQFARIVLSPGQPFWKRNAALGVVSQLQTEGAVDLLGRAYLAYPEGSDLRRAAEGSLGTLLRNGPAALRPVVQAKLKELGIPAGA